MPLVLSVQTLSVLLFACSVMLASSGCNRSPYFSNMPGGVPFQPNSGLGTGPAVTGPSAPGLNPASGAQMAELERRLRLLDDNNRQLTTQLAQSQQQMQIFRDRSDLLARQLQDVNGQLSQSRVAQVQASQQVQGLQASMQSRGGAKLVANNSLARQADTLRTIGFPVNIDGDVVRLSIPSDQLFQPGTAQLNPNAGPVLERVAENLLRSFPRQRVGVEGHTDSSPLQGGMYSTPHQLTSAQSMSVYEFMTRRAGIPSNQLFSLAHGTNIPVADNQAAVGRAQNRRIEIVVYPDTF